MVHGVVLATWLTIVVSSRERARVIVQQLGTQFQVSSPCQRQTSVIMIGMLKEPEIGGSIAIQT